MNVLIVQSDIYWSDPVANRSQLEEQIWQVEEEFDLVVLPEMFTTGFVMEPEKVAEPMGLHSHKWLLQMSRQFNAVFVGSLVIKEKGEYYNRCLVCFPDGRTEYYDKRHLFLGEEQDRYTKGSERLTFEYLGWVICPFVCYDLRFPVWTRNTLGKSYDLVLYSANWPQQRQAVWNTLLQARSLENAAFCVGVNRVGTSPENDYVGGSLAFNYKGEVIYAANDEQVLKVVSLSKNDLEEFRTKFPVLADQDDFKLLDQ